MSDEQVLELKTMMAEILDRLKKNKPEPAGLLLDATATARTMGISRTALYTLKDAGRLPSPINFGKRLVWSSDELRRWISAGCPSQDRWNKIKGADK